MGDSSSMIGGRDDLDDGLLAGRRYSELLAAYYPVVVARLLLRVPAGAAYEVASSVSLRLLEELRRGKRYPVPFRVVVGMVMRWTLADHFAERKARTEVSSLDDVAVAVDGGLDVDGLAGDAWVRYMIERLQGRQREVAWLRYVDGLEIAEIAERLGITRNAVDQALHNAHGRLRRLVDDA